MTLSQKEFLDHSACITLIGMAGSGKSTLGASLAKSMGCAFLDTDSLIESLYATPLQTITDTLKREEFLELEAEIICSLQASHCVIATGGSVVYMPKAMEKLKDLGPVIYLCADLAVIEQRIAQKPDRGLVIGENQTIADILRERIPLYEKYADYTCNAGKASVEECVAEILGQVQFIRQLSGKNRK